MKAMQPRKINKSGSLKTLMTGLVTIVLLNISCLTGLRAQEPAGAILTQEDLFAIILRYHPVARQADLHVQQAKADILVARSGFDPLAAASTARKTFDGTEYYNHVQPELRIPTWYGIEIVAGAEYLGGQRINTEKTTGKTSYAGVVMPLAKNLLMDKRRAALQTAKIYRDLSEIEKQSVLNDLLYEASQSYWEWVLQFQQYKVLTDAVRINEKRMQLIKKAYLGGDRPALDTTEALVQLQQFQFLQTDALLQWKNAGMNLSVYLWMDNNSSYELPPGVLPDTSLLIAHQDNDNLPPVTDLLQNLRSNHPDLLQYPLKLDALEIERKLKFQDLLPRLDVKYNQLGKGYNILNAASGSLFDNNYRFGIGFAVPLRLSQGRGEYRKAKLKIEAAKLERDWKTTQIENKIKIYYNELLALAAQADVLQKTYQNLTLLLKGEELKFFNGESSLFLVNSRENKTLEVLQKLFKTRAAYHKTKAGILWSAGMLHEERPL